MILWNKYSTVHTCLTVHHNNFFKIFFLYLQTTQSQLHNTADPLSHQCLLKDYNHYRFLTACMVPRNIWLLLNQSDGICDPAPLNEALWGDYQNQEWQFIAINTIFCTFWCINDYSTTFLSKVTVCWTSSCMMSLKTTL